MNSRGFGLLELLMGVTVGAAVVLSLGNGIGTITKMNVSDISKGELENQMAQAVQLIKRVGRAAQSCQKNGTILECSVYFGEPSGPTSEVQFSLSNTEPNQLVYQRQDPGGGAPSVQTFRGVSSLLVCDEEDMKADACGIPSGTISSFVKANLPLTNRFFRFQLTSVTIDNMTAQYPGAFYVRNPTPFPGVSYSYMGGYN